MNNNKMISISDYGFGVHTFELKLLNLTTEAYELLRDKMIKCKDGEKHRKCYYLMTYKYRGIRIKLYKYKRKPPYLAIIINPWLITHNEDDYARILTGFDKSELYKSIDSALKYYLGNEYGIERFKLTRVDCTVDFKLNDPDLARKYVYMVRHSVRRNRSLERMDILSEDDYRYCYRMSQEDFYSFTVYDKLYDLIQKKHLPNGRYDYGILRFELAFMHRKIHQIKEMLGTDSIVDLVEYYVNNSEALMKSFIKSKFVCGDYYDYNNANCIIKASGHSKKTRHRLLSVLMYKDYDSYTELAARIQKELGSEGKIRTLMEAFRFLDINPVVIPDGQRFGISYIPGMYRIFDLHSK